MLAGAFVAGGGLCFAAQRRTAPPPASGAGGQSRAGRVLLTPGFAVLAGVNLALGCFFGATQLSVTAFAVEHGTAGAAAWLFAVSSCASVLAGSVYGLRRWRAAPPIQLTVAAAWLAIAPLLALCSVLAEPAVDRAVLTQAFVWLNSATAAGSAGAAAAAGLGSGYLRRARRFHDGRDRHRRHDGTGRDRAMGTASAAPARDRSDRTAATGDR
jgi:hypothetical protein